MPPAPIWNVQRIADSRSRGVRCAGCGLILCKHSRLREMAVCRWRFGVCSLCIAGFLFALFFCVYGISLLHISVAYFCCVSVLQIYIAYLCCCVVVFCRLSLGVDVLSFGGVLGRFLVVLEGPRGVLGRLLAVLGGIGPLLGDLGWLLGRSWVALGLSWSLLGHFWPLLGR